MKKYITIAVLFVTTLAISQNLKLEDIMKGNEFIGVQPSNITLLPFDIGFLFNWTEDDTNLNDVFIYEYAIKKYRRLTEDEVNTMPRYYLMSEEKDQAFYLKEGNLYQWSKKSKHPRKLIESTKSIYNLQLVEGGKLVVYQEGDNLFAWNLEHSSLKQLTNFVAKSSNQPVLSPMDLEQLELFEYLKKKRERAEKHENNTVGFPVPEFALNGRRLSDLSIDPTGKHIFFKLTEKVDLEYTDMPKYVTQSGYTEMQKARPKVGRMDAKQELVYFSLEAGSYHEISLSSLPEIKTAPKYFKEYGRELLLENDRLTYIHAPIFSKQGDALIEVKSLDNKDRWLCLFDYRTKEIRSFEHQHDDAWIGGPGISGWNMVPGTIGWYNNGKRVYYQSEESGYSHLYSYNTEKTSKKQITNGKFEIHEAYLDEANKYFFITSNKSDAGNRSFYRFDIDAEKWLPVLTENGNYEVFVNENESKLVYRYSNATKPWEIYISDMSGKKNVQVTASQSKDFQNRTWIKPEIIEFKAEDGTMVRARKYAPKSGKENKAAVIFVHGAGYLQNAHNWWSGYYREYMFHNLLVEQGYTVLDIDYRASKGYGRDFRTDIYRHMGGKDLTDQLDGKKYLVENCGISADKIGIYGGSYGGFITLMALLTKPNEFACGAAIRSVTDWAHYNHEYTSNILNTPELDSVAYKKSGPIHFAKTLQDPLLMLHGLQDDNVQYQDIIRLSQRFIEAGVKDWELATYPIEPHGFKETSSWVDEYGRILKLFNEHLLD